MSDPKLISPMLDGFIMGESISDHNGVRCCPAIRENTDERYIVKIISIPASQIQLEALLLTGACKDTQSAQSYFMELSAGVVEEADILTRLSKLEGFAPYQNSQIVTMDEGVGYEVYLISPYKRSLEKQMRIQPLTHLGAVNLGLDLCSALAVCRRAGHLYVDLKPSNIFVTENQDYRIGDLGFIPITSLKYASLPEKYRSSYTAPEIRDAMASLNDTLDIYALGLVLYQVYNNGELPFEGDAPDVALPPPTYADYEMAEIILKACAPKPWERWQDPAQMGQALVNYMQRNGVNDTPIVPPPVQIPDDPTEMPEEQFLTEDENEEAMTAMLEQVPEENPMDIPAENAPVEDLPIEEAPSEDTAVAEVDPSAEDDTSVEENELSFMEELASDETAPTEELVQDLEGAVVTEEVSEMLAQADELIAHELPEPAVAPDPIDIPIPPPILPEDKEDDEVPAEITETNAEDSLDSVPDETETETEDDEEAEVSAVAPEIAENLNDVIEDSDEDESEIVDYEHFDPDSKPPKKINWIALIVAVLMVAAVACCGYYYYQNEYLQTIDSLQVVGSEDEITVLLSSKIDEKKLTVVCTDTYGNSRRSTVTSGTATFTNLDPGTQYKLQVEISGQHKLLGSTTGIYTTATETQIMNFTAAQGPEDGSVILSFSVSGPDSEQWSVAYAPAGSPEKVQDFIGHSVTITDLEAGTEYSFRLIAKESLYLTGGSTVRFTAKKLIYAQGLTITSCGGGSLTAQWSLPEGAEPQTWIVRCFNDSGYDETITTADTTITFDGLDHTTAYTIKVTAQGMTQSATAAITANPITITDFTQDLSVPFQLTVGWNFTGEAPAAGWLLSYSVNGGAVQTLECPENSAVLSAYPGDHYEFSLQCMDPVNFYPMDHAVDVPPLDLFEGFGLTAENLKFSMCKTPDKEDWNRKDLEDSDYTTEFALGESASFVVKRPKNSDSSEDTVTITYLIRNEEGQVISCDESTAVWDDLWNKRYCELDLPNMPVNVGSYTIEICFNDQLACSQAFTIH